jgi:dynein heavy chain
MELGKATPLLEEAAAVLRELKKDDFYILAGIKKPTPAVVLGMEISCHMMALKPKKEQKGKVEGDDGGFFECARTGLLNNPGKFMQDMKEYDKENISEKTVTRVNAIINSENFTMEKVKSASQALVAILKWSKAMMSYHELLKIVNPKRAKVKEMNEMLAVVRKSLAEKRARLKQVVDKIDGLERMFAEKMEL